MIVDPGTYVITEGTPVETNWMHTTANPVTVEVPANGTGRAVFNVSNIFVTCTIRQWPLGGTIVGLGNRTGLVLVNGTNRVEIPANATTIFAHLYTGLLLAGGYVIATLAPGL